MDVIVERLAHWGAPGPEVQGFANPSIARARALHIPLTAQTAWLNAGSRLVAAGYCVAVSSAGTERKSVEAATSGPLLTDKR